MSDDIKPAMRGEGDASVPRRNEDQESAGDAAGVFERFNPGAVPPDGSAGEGNVESPPPGLTPSPSIEAEPGQDPQAPNRKGRG